MREFRTYGSVRGALSNERPYRDNQREKGAGRSPAAALGTILSVTEHLRRNWFLNRPDQAASRALRALHPRSSQALLYVVPATDRTVRETGVRNDQLRFRQAIPNPLASPRTSGSREGGGGHVVSRLTPARPLGQAARAAIAELMFGGSGPLPLAVRAARED